MKLRIILFLISFLYIMPSSCILGFEFARKPPVIEKSEKYTKKSDLHKIAIGLSLFTSGLTGTDSIPLHIIKGSYFITGSLIALSGAAQLLAKMIDPYSDNQSFYPSSYEKLMHKLAHDNMFLTGAALSSIGLLLRCGSETRNTSDSALACTIVGMTLMGLVAGEQLSKDYLPSIKAYFNK